MKENKYIAYLQSCWISQKEIWNIFEEEKSAKIFFEKLTDGSLHSYVKDLNRRKKILENYKTINFKQIDAVLESLAVDLITLKDKDYPSSLRNIAHTPYILYVRWKIPKQDMFWVVWARKITSYGKKVIDKIIPDIAKIFPIVSGGAAGCDTEAHKATLLTWEKTVVVIWTGIDQCYPVGNEMLFDDVVVSWWAIVSIFPIGEPGNPYNFPVRNEIVVWLSKGILVVEAQKKSWSLITATLCLDLWKDLFAIPWDITLNNSLGTNLLIKKWEAKCVTESLDILEEYHFLVKKVSQIEKALELGTFELEIYESISQEELNIDSLVEKLGRPAHEITIKLSLLELRKLIKKNLSGKYSLN